MNLPLPFLSSKLELNIRYSNPIVSHIFVMIIILYCLLQRWTGKFFKCCSLFYNDKIIIPTCPTYHISSIVKCSTGAWPKN